MARRGHSPTPAIPKASFVKVEDAASTQPAGVHDQQARSYGYNDFSSFARPENYIRYIEPLESELAVQVEYDMDEQDQEWLDAVNNERRAEQLNKVTYEVFEIIMDRLEKEWFNLTKNISKPDMVLPSEDSTCAICDDAEGENSNAIVFCDGCNLAVHQDCYGVPYIPEGQWLCRKCTVSPEIPVSCILCPNEGGAFKQTVNGEWAHLLCAIWVPETRVANDVFMEPITGVDKINKQRWKLKCSLCGVREGACIQCSKASCVLAFHATCARREKLLMPMKSAHGAEPATLACYCEKHLPEEQQAAHEAALQELAAEPNSSFEYENSNSNIHTPRSSKKARAYAKTYKLGPPLVPAIIVQRIMEYIGKVSVRKKLDFVHLVCRYWSLKREARRGAPLLKRLHLEPWTASTVNKTLSDEEMAIKLEYLKRLRTDLEAVRMLAELTRKREIQKLKQTQLVHDLISTFFFPHAPELRSAFERIIALDRHDFFKNPVSKNEVPDYFDIIKHPMCWKTIDKKLEANEYINLKGFEDDIHLVLENARTYNKADTPIYKAAARIKASAEHILAELHQLPRSIPVDSPEKDTVGNLEPPLSVLDLLFSTQAVDDDIPYIIDTDPISFLFSYELGKLRPPPPPPPPKPPKPKRDREAEKERRKQRMLDHAAGFRAPIVRTRRAIAELQAFEAEAFEADAVGTTGSVVDAEESLEDQSDERSERSRGRKKRAPFALPGLSEVPPVVDDVDSQRSFNMFDQGWILSSTTRRGGRAPIEKRDRPPKKRQRTDKERQLSTLSMYSTPAAENQTLIEGEEQPLGSEEQYEGIEGQDVEERLEEDEQQVEAEDRRGESEGQWERMEVREEGSDVLPMEIEDQHIDRDEQRIESGEQVSDERSNKGLDEVQVQKREESVPAELSMLDQPEDEGLEAGPDSMEVEPMLEAEPAAQLAAEIVSLPMAVVEKTPRGKKPYKPPRIVIEELDTPAIRKAKNRARKQKKIEEQAEREREERALAEAAEPEPEVQMALADSQSELSPLSSLDGENWLGEDDDQLTELESDEESDYAELDGPGMVVSAARARKTAQMAGLGPATIKLREVDVLEGGTLVWAKADTYPWWPAVIYEDDDPDVPGPVLNGKEHARVGGEGPMLLVQFWDARKTWQWLPLDKLRLLGEDKALDADMLNGNTKLQRFKNMKVRDQCHAAWRDAIAEMETGAVSGR